MTTHTMPNVATIKVNSAQMMIQFGAPMTSDNLQRLAEKYEKAYRRHRVSKRPPETRYLLAELRTARAFYSLARDAFAVGK